VALSLPSVSHTAGWPSYYQLCMREGWGDFAFPCFAFLLGYSAAAYHNIMMPGIVKMSRCQPGHAQHSTVHADKAVTKTLKTTCKL
jgi:hypothetical protein